jgi:uncharacterized membrane protein YphA (DoxX/SURF4 family)
MLNVFPDLLSLSILAPTVIRLVVGIFLVVLGWKTITKKRLAFESYFQAKQYPLAAWLPWKLGMAEILVGIFIIIGFFTQVAALLAVYIFFTLMYIDDRKEKIFPYTATFYLVLVFVTLTLLITGAGAFAFDLPL